jgi:hypothetical protein
MFTEKKKELIKKASGKSTNAFVASGTGSANGFVAAGRKKAATTRSENGAVKYSTTGNSFIDEFGTAASFKAPRSFDDVAKSMSTLWADGKLMCVKFLFYLRMITRTVQFPDGNKTSEVQRGQGLKHEGIFRMMWLAVNHPDTFWKNIYQYISVGGWKDIITMLSYDLQYNGWEGRKLDWTKMGKLILAGLENDKTSNLVKKYLPQIKANSKCTTLESQADNIIAKWICSLLFGTKDSSANYKKYRKLKTSGTAHEWQKLISQNKLLKLNFDTIHGRALSQLVSGKFLKNNGLEDRYQKWIAAKPVAKYTGYVYELFQTIPTEKYKIDTINSQFKGLVETAKKGAETATSFIVVRDTSLSMGQLATGTKMSAYNVAKALALFFSEMLPDGHFANSWIEFNSTAKLHEWKGSTPMEKWNNDRSGFVGSTDFQSVIDLFCKIKKDGVKESEFPTGILCISDNEFNPASLNTTNVEDAINKLKAAGFSKSYTDKFKIVLWNVARGQSSKFETHGAVKNVFYLSGMDGSVVSFITGMKVQDKAPSTPEELFNAAMDQEVLNMLEV